MHSKSNPGMIEEPLVFDRDKSFDNAFRDIGIFNENTFLLAVDADQFVIGAIDTQRIVPFHRNGRAGMWQIIGEVNKCYASNKTRNNAKR